MKTKFLLIALMMFAISANAQDEENQSKDKNFFNHLSVGLNVGTPGIGIDVAMPICDYVQVRAGVSFIPSIKFSTDLDITSPEVQGYNIPEEVEVEGKVGFTNGKLLFDIYPFKNCGFFVSAGAYFGSSKPVKAYNKQDGILQAVSDYNNAVEDRKINASKIGAELGDYLLEPDDDGNVNAYIKTSSFKPYLGIGYGRAVPKKRVGFMVELGVQFWGSPKVYCEDHKLEESDVDGDGGDILKTISKITVYPTLNFRICGRIF